MTDIKLRLFQFNDVHTAVVDCVKTFIDPKTIPDPEDPEAPAATNILTDVRKSRPSKISLFGDKMGIARFDMASVKVASMGGGLIAEVSGGLEIWIAGRSDDSENLSKYYCDIARAYFQNKNIVDFPGVTIKPGKDDPKWANINLADPRKTKVPVYYTLGYVEYTVTISKRNQYVIPGG